MYIYIGIIFFLPKNSFFWLLSWRGANNKNWGESGGKGCMYTKDWFKSIFPLFITGLLDLTAYNPGWFCAPPPIQCYCPSYVYVYLDTALEIIVSSFFCFQCVWNICYFPDRNSVSSYVITDLVSLTTVQEEYKKRNLLNELYMAQKDEMHKCCEQQSYK